MLSCRQRPPWNAIRTIDPSWPLDWIIAPLPAPAFILFARPSTLANDSRPADRDASSPGKMPPGIQDGTLPSEIARTRRGRGKKKGKGTTTCFEQQLWFRRAHRFRGEETKIGFCFHPGTRRESFAWIWTDLFVGGKENSILDSINRFRFPPLLVRDDNTLVRKVNVFKNRFQFISQRSTNGVTENGIPRSKNSFLRTSFQDQGHRYRNPNNIWNSSSLSSNKYR